MYDTCLLFKSGGSIDMTYTTEAFFNSSRFQSQFSLLPAINFFNLNSETFSSFSTNAPIFQLKIQFLLMCRMYL